MLSIHAAAKSNSRHPCVRRAGRPARLCCDCPTAGAEVALPPRVLTAISNSPQPVLKLLHWRPRPCPTQQSSHSEAIFLNFAGHSRTMRIPSKTQQALRKDGSRGSTMPLEGAIYPCDQTSGQMTKRRILRCRDGRGTAASQLFVARLTDIHAMLRTPYVATHLVAIASIGCWDSEAA